MFLGRSLSRLRERGDGNSFSSSYVKRASRETRPHLLCPET
jgi:hypothetical protein